MLIEQVPDSSVYYGILHADFYRVAMDKLLRATIPVVTKGEPKGVKQQGGILEFIRRGIQVEVLPGTFRSMFVSRS